MKMKAEVMYSTYKPWKLLFIVALPGMISMFAMSLYNIIDGAFIGHMLGEEAFAAVNIAFPLTMINFSIADLIGVGSSAPVSIALGRGDNKTANNIFSCSVVMIFIASAIMGSIMFLAAEPLSRMMGANDELIDPAVRYLRTYALCSPLTTIFFAMDNYLRISGFIKTSMIINIFSNVATVALIILFLFFFRMDVVGSALAVCISMCVCSLIAFIPFLAKNTLLQFVRPKFHFAMIKEIAACGSPVFLSNIAGRVTSIFMNISLMTLGVRALGEGGGTTAVAAFAVVMYSSDMVQFLLYGISDALSPAIGYNWGAERYDRVKAITKCVFVGNCVVSLISTAVIFFLARPIVSIYASADDVQLFELSVHALRLFCFVYLFRWLSLAAQSFLSAIEKPIQSTLLSVAVALVFPAVVLVALWGLGLDGIWLNTFGTSVLAGIMSGILLLRGGREI